MLIVKLVIGQAVLVRNLLGEHKWLQLGTVLEQTGPVSYKAQVGDRVWRRQCHVDQLLLEANAEGVERNVESHDCSYPVTDTEPEGQNEEPTVGDESTLQIEETEPDVTDPPENNVTKTTCYPKRPH